MEVKKFLDEQGLSYLWKKLSLQDYPNNDTLVAVINAIDEGKMDKTTAIPLIEQAIAGQVPVVKSVDENGKPVEWEASELLPKTKEPNKQLVSDSNKVIKWEDRTHYIHREPIVVLPEIYIENKKAAVVTQYTNYEQTFKAGQVYNVIYNGKEYQSTAWYNEDMLTTSLGNESLMGEETDSGEPFFFNTSEVPQMSFVYFSAQGNHTISINSGYNETYIPLDEKYLPATVPVIDTAQVGEVPIVKEVDENGKPISWEARELTPELSFKIISYPDYGILMSEKTFKEVDDFAFKNGLNNLNLSLFIAGTTLYNEDERRNPYYYVISCDKVRGITEEETIAYDFTFIVDQEKRVYRLNENGVSLISSSKNIPDTTEPNQYLTTNENGEKIWENKTHYLTEQIVTNVEETTGTGKYIPYYVTYGLKLGKEYTILHNGTEYKCTSFDLRGDVVLGNLSLGMSGAENTGEPFVFLGSKTDGVYVYYAIFQEDTTHTFSITGPTDIATPLSDKFIPSNVPKVIFGEVGEVAIITEVQGSRPKKWSTVKLPTKTSDLENDANFATQTDITPLQSAIDTLNGTGEGSVRDTVADAVATIVAQAPEDFDTLKEIADWIANDETGTLDLIGRVEKAEADIEDLKPLDVQADWKQTDETAMDFIKNKPNEDDALALLAETGFIEPVAAADGSVFTDSNGVLYTL